MTDRSPSSSVDPRYPTGRYVRPAEFTSASRDAGITALAAQPALLRRAVAGLSDSQLDTPYRPGGWTARQVTHHLADAHANAYIRTRLALTEENPTIRPYDQVRWAELPDARTLPVEPSLAMLEAIHLRWVALLRSLGDAQFRRPFVHPESGNRTVDDLITEYGWEGHHHIGQITDLRRREGW